MMKFVKKQMKELLFERGTRKYTFALVSLGSLFGGLLLGAFLPLLLAQYGVFAGSVVALYVAFAGGNVVNKWVAPNEDNSLENKEVQRVQSGE